MFENVINFLKSVGKKEQKQQEKSKDAAKERLQLVLMQDRANISADFLDLMKQEIIEVIKKYIDVDENAIDVRLTNRANDDGTNGAPSLYANIPIISIKEEVRVGMSRQGNKEDEKVENEKNSEIEKENEEITINSVEQKIEENNEQINEQSKELPQEHALTIDNEIEQQLVENEKNEEEQLESINNNEIVLEEKETTNESENIKEENDIQTKYERLDIKKKRHNGKHKNRKKHR